MNDIVPIGGQVPAYLQKCLEEGKDWAADAGDVTPQDIGLNFLKLVHGSSNESKPNWNGPGSTPLPQGTMILSQAKTIIPVGTVIVPLLRKTKFVKWKDNDPNTKVILGITNSEKDPRILKDGGMEWRQQEDGSKLPPLWMKYVNFWVTSKFNPDEPAIISFHRTSLPLARDLTGDLMRKTRGWKAPLYCFMYRLDAPEFETRPKGTYPQFNISFENFLPDSMLPKIETAYKNAQALWSATADITHLPVDDETVTAEAATPVIPEDVSKVMRQQLEEDLSTPVQTPMVLPSGVTSAPAPAAPAVQDAVPLW